MSERQTKLRRKRTAPARVFVWFWGTGGAGIRLTDRIATILAEILSPSQVSLSCHSDNKLWKDAVARGHRVTTVSGAAGHHSVCALALQAIPRFYRLWRHLRVERPDAVLIPMNFAFAWPFCLLLRMMHIPYAFIVHDAVPHVGDFAPTWQWLTQRGLIAYADSVVAPSAYTARELENALSSDTSVRVLPLASLARRTRTGARDNLGRPVRFLFLGRLIAYKGLKLLADALISLKDRDDWTLTIAGAGPEKDNVYTAFRATRQVDLTNLAPLPEQAIEQLISSHDILVCPYIEASQSGVISEAQADGMPCVVTPVGALPEQIGNGRSGWVAAGMRPVDLAAVLIHILDFAYDFKEKSQGATDMVSDLVARDSLTVILGDLLGSSWLEISPGQDEKRSIGLLL